MSVDHITYYTPLQDYTGSITPASLHFVQYHASHFPDIDAEQHRLTIHGMVDRPMSFSMDDLKRLPSVSRVHFVECHANSSPMIHGTGNANMGPPVQYIHGMASCSEWTGVPLASVLNLARLRPETRYVVLHCADSLERGGDLYYESIDLIDAYHPQTILAYELNGKPLEVPNGAPLRLRVERQLGYKQAKYLMRLEAVADMHHIHGGKGGFWEDRGYEWYAGI